MTATGKGVPLDPGIAPKVMRDEVERLSADLQELIASVFEQLAASSSPKEWRSVSEVYLTGAGDSFAAAHAARMAYETIGATRCEPMNVQSFVEYAVPAIRLGGGRPLVIAASVSGRTPRVVEAVERARAVGALTLGITTTADSPLTRATHASVVVPLREPVRSPGIRSFQATLLAMLGAAVQLGACREETVDLPALRREMLDLAHVIDGTLAATKSASAEAADAMARTRVACMLGSGPMFGIALFSAAKVIEAARLLVVGQDLEEWWHVERRALPDDMPVFVLAPSGRSRRRALAVAAAARAYGRTVFGIAPRSDHEMAARVDSMLPVTSHVREEFSPLVYQLFAPYVASLVCERLGQSVFAGERHDLPTTLDGFLPAADLS
jgi:glutamine---fructose-6-phosphate transaminase (isomerizing)